MASTARQVSKFSVTILIYLSLATCLLASNFSYAKNTQCAGYLSYSKYGSDSLFSEETLDQITSIQNSLSPFPKINRTLNLEKITRIVQEFELFAERIRTHSESDFLTPKEALILDNVYRRVIELIKNYKSNIKRKDDLSKKSGHLIQLSNLIKGTYFEGLIGILLSKEQFLNIETNIYAHRLLSFASMDRKNIHPEDYNFIKSHKNTELDFIAQKDGTNYIIEVKSFTPTTGNPFLLRSLDGVRKQVQIRKRILSTLDLDSNWKVLVIFHYGIGHDLETEFLSDADNVYSLYHFSNIDRPE